MNVGGQGGGIGNAGGAQDFLQRALQSIGGGARTSQTTGVANNSTIQFNPTIVQSSGGNPTVAPSIGGASGAPTSSATSSAAGQDPSSLYSRSLPSYRTTPAGQPLYDPLNTMGGGMGGDDMTIPLLIGAGVLFFALQD